MSFYVGSYLILADALEPKTDSGPWALPDDQDQHMADTSNVEELFLDIVDMDVLPTQIQFGADQWSADEGFTPDDSFVEFYVPTEYFYVRGFTATNYFAEYYIRDEAFYLRGFTATDYWTPMFYQTGNFYVRNFAPTDSWTPMFYQTGYFYVRSFTATNFWSEFYPGDYD